MFLWLVLHWLKPPTRMVTHPHPHHRTNKPTGQIHKVGVGSAVGDMVVTTTKWVLACKMAWVAADRACTWMARVLALWLVLAMVYT